MPKFECIDRSLRDFIETQKVFFVATAAPEGRVNVAPKGMDTLRVQGPNRDRMAQSDWKRERDGRLSH
jgi:predicted pyridoxine 5'-phosphate oxidase superfamily flavin-nucleotide-binding protein